MSYEEEDTCHMRRRMHVAARLPTSRQHSPATRPRFQKSYTMLHILGYISYVRPHILCYIFGIKTLYDASTKRRHSLRRASVANVLLNVLLMCC
jgi:hypothetical protein